MTDIPSDMVNNFKIVQIDGAFHVVEMFATPLAALWPYEFASEAEAEAFLNLAVKSSITTGSESWRDMFTAHKELQRVLFTTMPRMLCILTSMQSWSSLKLQLKAS